MTAKKALKAEAVPTELNFEYDAVAYTAPHPKIWPLEAVEAQEEGRLTTCVRKILGEDQYGKFKEKPRTLEDLDNLMEALFEAAEVELGK